MKLDLIAIARLRNARQSKLWAYRERLRQRALPRLQAAVERHSLPRAPAPPPMAARPAPVTRPIGDTGGLRFR